MRFLSLTLLLGFFASGCSGAGEIIPVMDTNNEEISDQDQSTTKDVAGTDQAQSDQTLTDLMPTDQTCTPNCSGKECGDDGCGGDCGKCPLAAPICAEGVCTIKCVPSCDAKECGGDGCGGDCGKCPAAAPFCKTGVCAVECDADCEGRNCGDDGCGGSCGMCQASWDCTQGVCSCEPECAGKQCGLDACGGVCGECSAEEPFCVAGKCQSTCTPNCNGKECGDNGCGGSCGPCEGANNTCFEGECVCSPSCPQGACGSDGCGGSCPACGCGAVCQQGKCVSTTCDGKQCGDNGCGGTCGICPGGFVCGSDDMCLDSCDLACVGKQCGDNGCGGVCGVCAGTKSCTDYGSCVETCTSHCAGKACGSDGCGGSCGTCGASTPFCNQGVCEALCEPNCGIKVCGQDGCGGNCGTCTAPLECTVAGTCGGLCANCGYQQVCFDQNFAEGDLGMWNIDGAEVIANLGLTVAPTGGHMLKLSTADNGIFGEPDTSSATMQNCLPAGNYVMMVSWKLFSEEFKEFCDSQFQDTFTIEVTPVSGQGSTQSYKIEDLCEPNGCTGCGSHYSSLTQSDVEFDQGDVWYTGWYEDAIPVVLSGPDTRFSIKLSAEDAGDGVYDTVVLVDRIRFIPGSQSCEYLECGPNPFGESCGQCAQGSLCISGTCCTPSCAGKECGGDGCGGTCGQCGSNTMCLQGICECKELKCTDGCCDPGEMCGSMSGKCCMPQCTGVPCAANGCGGLCPGPAGATCCSSAGQCNDGNACTVDTCSSGYCHHTPSGTPACCADFSFIENFDDGLAQEFTILNADGGFGLGEGWSVTNACGSHSSAYSLYFGFPAGSPFGGTACTYGIGGFPIPIPVSGTVTSSVMDLPAAPTQLSFWVYPDILAAPEYDDLSVFIVLGATENLIWDKTDLTQGVSTTWQHVVLDLSAYSGESIQVRFLFDTVGSIETGKTGPRIDDVKVQGLCP